MADKRLHECYDEWWLHSDMDNMGYIFEYCQKHCLEMFGIKINKLMFLNAFMCSDCRAAMETGDPKLLSQSGKDSIKTFVTFDCQKNILPFELASKEGNFCFHQLFWVGWMYAYIHYRTTLPSRELIKILPIEQMLEEYHLGHEMSKETYFSHIQHLF